MIIFGDLCGAIYMKIKFGLTILILLSAISMLTATPRGINGTLDLSSWDFEKQGPAKLDGSWFFFEKEFVSPGIIEKKMKKAELILVPSLWSGVTIKGKTIASQNYGTYYVKLKLRKKGAVNFKFPTVGTAFDFYINSKKIASVGKIGKSRKDMIGAYKPQIVEYKAESTELNIVVHISNFYHREGGLWYSILVGASNDLNKIRNKQLQADFFKIGIFFIMFLYHIVLVILRPKEKLPLYFAAICLLFGLRGMVFDEIILLNFFPQLSLDWLLTVNFVTFYATTGVLFAFLYKSFTEEFNKYIFYVVSAVSFVMTAFVVVTPGIIFTQTLYYFQGFAFLIMPYAVYCLFMALVHKREGAWHVFIGMIILIVSIINDMLYSMQIIWTGYLFSYGLLVFIFFQSILLASRFSKAFLATEILTAELEVKNIELNDLNQNLEYKVEERTEELQAMNEEVIAINESLSATRDQLWGEMQLAKKIQTVLLPEKPHIDGYEISAHMAPADDVGGDYYDIINVNDIDWIVIGDVSGHGVPAGLIMMMVQTSIHTALEDSDELRPSQLLSRVNKVITGNIKRLNEDKYMTITVIGCVKDGKFYYSGLHQDILIYKYQSDSLVSVETNGMWLGLMDNIEPMLDDKYFTMNENDVMLLYTDGITEAWEKGSVKDNRDPETQMFGQDRLEKTFMQSGKKDTNEIIEELKRAMDNYVAGDDVTILVIKRVF